MVTHVVKVPPSNLTIDVNNDDLFENMNKALAFLVKLFSLQYSSPTYNRLTTLSNTKNQAHVQVSQINVQGKNTDDDEEELNATCVIMSRFKNLTSVVMEGLVLPMTLTA
ncbi:hypothetical protein Tco_0665551 [Tanacetum coccineum]